MKPMSDEQLTSIRNYLDLAEQNGSKTMSGSYARNLLGEVEQQRAKLNQLREPHEEYAGHGVCVDCASTWPCRTARIIDGGES